MSPCARRIWRAIQASLSDFSAVVEEADDEVEKGLSLLSKKRMFRMLLDPGKGRENDGEAEKDVNGEFIVESRDISEASRADAAQGKPSPMFKSCTVSKAYANTGASCHGRKGG